MALYWGVLEESLYRGYLMGALTRLTSRFWLVNLGQAVVFSAAHVLVHHAEHVDVWAIARWVLMGVIFGWLARRSQSLWPAFICHFVLDLLVLYAVLMPQYDDLRTFAIFVG